MKHSKLYLLLTFFTLILFSSCVMHVDIQDCVSDDPYGFWHGLWHGIIAPIDLIAMVFNDKYAVYATNNNGAWYAFGFILGSGGWGFLGASKKGKKR